MGRWSELRVQWVDQVASIAKWALMRERSGDERGPLAGALVWVSSLRSARGLLLMARSKASPLLAALSSPVWECHAA